MPKKKKVKNVMVISFKHLFKKDDVEIKKLFKTGITLIPILDKNFQLLDIVAYVDYIKNYW